MTELERLNEAVVVALAALSDRSVSNAQKIMDAIAILEAAVTFEGEWSTEASRMIARLYRELNEARAQTDFVKEAEADAMTGKQRDAADEIYRREDE